MNRLLPLAAWAAGLLLGASALLNAFFLFQQWMIHKDLENLNSKTGGPGQAQAIVQRGNQIQAVTQGLVNDLIAYSRKEPAVLPLLQKYGASASPPAQPSPPPPPP